MVQVGGSSAVPGLSQSDACSDSSAMARTVTDSVEWLAECPSVATPVCSPPPLAVAIHLAAFRS